MQDEDAWDRRSRPPALTGSGASGVESDSGDHDWVVPANQLLDVAAALSEGASRVHAQLRHLPAADRDAVLDIVAGHLNEIVTLWTSLVRGVIATGPEPDAVDQYENRDEPQPREPLAAIADLRPPVPTDEYLRPVPTDRVPGERATTEHVNPYRRPPTTSEGPLAVDPLPRDELTGVLTRQAGFTALTKEIERCRHSGDRFVLGYLNVDGIKAVNDARGPRAGDELLRKVTAALRATLRSYDVICRLGGDEFLFSLPGADLATAELRFKEFAVILAEEAPGGSASVGFAQLRDNDTIDDLIARADTALLKSRRGRRRAAR